MKNQLSAMLFWLARNPISKFFIGFSFAHLHFLLPVKRIIETQHTLAFFHPVPSYQFHALAVPKKRKSSFLEIDLSAIGDPEYLLDLLAVCQQIARDQGLNRYSIIVNGGDYQDVPQVHFHIAANDDDAHREESTNLIEANGDFPLDEPLHLFKPHSTRWAYHQIVQHERLVSGFRDLLFEVEQTQDCLIELFEGAQKLLSIKPLAAFSVILYVQPDQNKRVQLEIVSNMVA